jgi:rhamnulokinase
VLFMKELNMIAFDLGASSGRGIIGRFNGSRLEVEELNRFSNDPVDISGHTFWDILRLYWEIQQGLLKFANEKHGSIASVGIDTWGVDFGLLDKAGQLLGNPYHYRDVRTDGMFEEAFKRMPREEIYNRTGIAFQKFNTLYQLLSIRLNDPEMLDRASVMLFIPDLLTYFLTGEKMTEFTEATTSQLLDAKSRTWSGELLKSMEIPDHFLTEIDFPGAIRGRIKKDIASLLGINEAPLIAVATHDTGSAVAAVPAQEVNYAFLSSGTWSLMGVEVEQPIINEETLRWNYTNEGCVGGKYRLLRNIMGLWIIQECKREWDRKGEVYSYGDMVHMAESSPGFVSFIDPDDDLFYNAGDMPAKVQHYCQQTNQTVPETKGEIIRCVYESLAMKYRWSFERLEAILGKSLDVLHIVGGGSQNKLLNQFTANALKKPVICGPTEATAIGNLMVQAMALGEVKDQNEIRQVVKESFPTEDYFPAETDAWDEAYSRFLKLQNGESLT